MKKYKILFVCMGNICRSPAAEGVFNKIIKDNNMLDNFIIDSAGTISYHAGNKADIRSIKEAKLRGIDLNKIRSRKIITADFTEFDYILAMDNNNMTDLLNICPLKYRSKIKLLLSYFKHTNIQEIADPYYGGSDGFKEMFDLITKANIALFKHIKKQ